MRFLLSASILSLAIPFLSVQAMSLGDDPESLRTSSQRTSVASSNERTRAELSEELRKYENRLYSLGRMQGMNSMSCIKSVITAIVDKKEIPEDIRQEHVVNWLREAVEDEKDLDSLYRLYQITGVDENLWASVQKAGIDLVALADDSKDLEVKRAVVTLLYTHNQAVPERLYNAIGLTRFSYGCGLASIGKQ